MGLTCNVYGGKDKRTYSLKDLKQRDQSGVLGTYGRTALTCMLHNWALKIRIQFSYIRLDLKVGLLWPR
jgi:hypothetical protein